MQQLKAIKKVRHQYDNVHVMLPFVRNVNEVRKVLGIMATEGLVRSDNFKIYLMAEVPSKNNAELKFRVVSNW